MDAINPKTKFHTGKKLEQLFVVAGDVIYTCMHIFMFVCNSVSVLIIICITPFPYCITYMSQDIRICFVFYFLLIKTYVKEADVFLITSRSSLTKSIITSQTFLSI